MMFLTVSDLAMSFVRAFINLMSMLETIEAHLETLGYLIALRYRLSFMLDYSIGRLVTLVVYLWVLLLLAVGRP